MNDPALLLPMLLAPTVAVMVFSVLLLTGLAVVRRLKLPLDLPELARHEPPPPLLVMEAGPDAARAHGHGAGLRVFRS